jgi:hypothetical protein
MRSNHDDSRLASATSPDDDLLTTTRLKGKLKGTLRTNPPILINDLTHHQTIPTSHSPNAMHQDGCTTCSERYPPATLPSPSRTRPNRRLSQSQVVPARGDPSSLAPLALRLLGLFWKIRGTPSLSLPEPPPHQHGRAPEEMRRVPWKIVCASVLGGNLREAFCRAHTRSPS